MTALMNAKSMNDAQMLIDAMLSIQTQLSEIQENQRKMMKAMRDLRREQRCRLSDLKKSTQVLLKDTHSKLADQINELQGCVDEQLDDMSEDEFSLEDLFK